MTIHCPKCQSPITCEIWDDIKCTCGYTAVIDDMRVMDE